MTSNSNTLSFDLDHDALPSYIAIEGPIGAGKTTLTRRLAETLGYDTLLEHPEDNPFLPRFYQESRHFALQTQLQFLFQRAEQLQKLHQQDIFRPGLVSDFIIEKDPLFAEATLDSDELALYQKVYNQLALNTPAPDLVIYLQAPTEVLVERVKKRGLAFEEHIASDYLSAINDAYTRFFHYYQAAPLLIINASDIDLVNSEEDYHNLVNFMLRIRQGRHYYNPAPHT